jgi:hypothetical protein
MSAEEFTPTGAPKVSAAVLRKMSGSNPFGEGVWCGVCVVWCMAVILSFPCLVLTSTSLHLLPFPVLLSLSSPLLSFCPSLLPSYPHYLGDTPATHTPNCPHYFPLSSHTLTPHTHTLTHTHTHTHTPHTTSSPPLSPFLYTHVQVPMLLTAQRMPYSAVERKAVQRARLSVHSLTSDRLTAPSRTS